MKNSVTDWLTERIFIYPENYDNSPPDTTRTRRVALSSPLLNIALPEQCLAKSMSLYMQIFVISSEEEWVSARYGQQFRCFALLLFSTKFIETRPLFLMKSNALRWSSGTAAERLKNVQINFMTAFVCYVHIFPVLHTVLGLLLPPPDILPTVPLA